MLQRVAHRSQTSCTSDEAWTKYIVLNRNGSANQLEQSSRTFNPLVIFNEMKLQNNLMHLETRVRLVLELADVRILAFGTLNRPRASRNINPNAHAFLHPPGIDNTRPANLGPPPSVDDHGVYPMQNSSHQACTNFGAPSAPYERLTHPLPAPSHTHYPFFTPGGGDKRWLGTGEFEESGLNWVGPLMIVAQVLGPHTHDLSGDWPPFQDLDLAVGPGRTQYASMVWRDLWAIAPWMDERITKRIEGPGLGL
ncbi:hypothetical protein HGRIS_009332 [Hohenbuehelia grisea]|uniref:Uncharacterized protein n=1 Tax=Hohenbuehelia grisea TaxID=104357 RepID=A0ABR3J0Y8_9AGAR